MYVTCAAVEYQCIGISKSLEHIYTAKTTYILLRVVMIEQHLIEIEIFCIM